MGRKKRASGLGKQPAFSTGSRKWSSFATTADGKIVTIAVPVEGGTRAVRVMRSPIVLATATASPAAQNG